MSIFRVLVKPHMSPVQRLATRLLRNDSYSLNQVSAVVGFTPGVIVTVSKDIGPNDVERVTLRELGAPGNKALFDALFSAAMDFVAQRLALLNVGQPRGSVT